MSLSAELALAHDQNSSAVARVPPHARHSFIEATTAMDLKTNFWVTSRQGLHVLVQAAANGDYEAMVNLRVLVALGART